LTRLDLLDITPDARAGVEDEHVGLAQIGPHPGERRLDGGFVGDVAGIGLGVRKFAGEPSRQIGAPRHQRHGVTVGGEAPGERLAIARAEAGDRADRKVGPTRHWFASITGAAARMDRSTSPFLGLSCDAAPRRATTAETTGALFAAHLGRCGRAPFDLGRLTVGRERVNSRAKRRRSTRPATRHGEEPEDRR
jgi:hypothetical protein